MLSEHVHPVGEHLPEGTPRGCVLVVSDYRLLNLSHATAVRSAGYAVYTAVTCTDVPRIFESYSVGEVDLVAFASLVHGWHHEEAEERPDEIPAGTDAHWQTRNIVQVVDSVRARQETAPKILVATDLLEHECYDVCPEALEAAGLAIEPYSASNPPSIVKFLQ
jgi:hypothetical protein